MWIPRSSIGSTPEWPKRRKRFATTSAIRLEAAEGKALVGRGRVQVDLHDSGHRAVLPASRVIDAGRGLNLVRVVDRLLRDVAVVANGSLPIKELHGAR